MEAPGIEPGSRDVSASASTCVVAVLNLAASGPHATRSVAASPTECPGRVTGQHPAGKPAIFALSSLAGKARRTGRYL